MPNAASKAAQAWNAVKPAGDPEFTDLPMEIRHKLTHLADRYLAGHAEKVGDYAPQRFRDAVLSIDGVPFRAAAVQAYDSGGNERDIVSGDPIVDLDSRTMMEPHPVDSIPGQTDAPTHLLHGDGVDIRPDPIPEPGGVSGTITVETDDEGRSSATVSVVSETIAPKQGPLPEDFPGYAHLVAKGITTYAKARKAKLEDVPGIGPATIEKIAARLAE